jgi:hypothetical protein
MQKSSRHSRITGHSGAASILYWLSKRGFECAHVDHTGIDLIARRPATEEVLSISVKFRSRIDPKDEAGVNLLHKNDEKIEAACRAFRCVPYVAVVGDQGETVREFVTTPSHARTQYPGQSWRMSPAMIKRYQKDPQVESFELVSRAGDWMAER